MPAQPLMTAALVATLVVMPVGKAQDQTPPEVDQPFRLNLPEWNPAPESLPPELRPLDVVRPVLPEDVAAKVEQLNERIEDLEKRALTAETREEQDAALDEAIGLAERVLAMRVEHQGSTEELIRWRDAAGEPSEWHEVIVARQQVEDLRLIRDLNKEDRATLASLIGTDAEVERLYGEGKYAEAQAVTELQLDIYRRVLGAEHPDTLGSNNNMGILLESRGRYVEAELYYRESLEGRRRVLGDEHTDTLHSINNMGALLESQGQLGEA